MAKSSGLRDETKLGYSRGVGCGDDAPPPDVDDPVAGAAVDGGSGSVAPASSRSFNDRPSA